MTHHGISWDPGTWTVDYREHFSRFKKCIKQACKWFFPRYDLPWCTVDSPVRRQRACSRSDPFPSQNQPRRIDRTPAHSFQLQAVLRSGPEVGCLQTQSLCNIPCRALVCMVPPRQGIPCGNRPSESAMDRDITVSHRMPLESPPTIVSFQDQAHSRQGQRGSGLDVAPSNQPPPFLFVSLPRMFCTRIARQPFARSIRR